MPRIPEAHFSRRHLMQSSLGLSLLASSAVATGHYTPDIAKGLTNQAECARSGRIYLPVAIGSGTPMNW
ncbi:MAG TPA: hypothetical protein VLL08_29320 [Kineosporiaceae bacterium]|nr:hypothetical protein [Kineosporiaceae bacterium]